MTAEEKSAFCSGGQITDINCVDADTGDGWESLAEASCTVDDGLSCTNVPLDGIPPCRDYKIKYMCNCTGLLAVDTLYFINMSLYSFCI